MGGGRYVLSTWCFVCAHGPAGESLMGEIPEVPGRISCQNPWTDIPSALFVCLLPSPFPPTSHCGFSSGSDGSLHLQPAWWGQSPTHRLHLPPPLPERSCWLSAIPVTAASAIASSGTTPLALQPPLRFNPPTSTCTDGWISWVSWWAVWRCFCLFMDIQLVVN